MRIVCWLKSISFSIFLDNYIINGLFYENSLYKIVTLKRPYFDWEKYVFVCVEVHNNFTCISLENDRSSNAPYAAKSLGVTSTSQAKNGVSMVYSVVSAM